MGSPISEMDRDGDEVLHRVRLTRGFWMLETPVTQSFYLQIMGTNPSEFKNDDHPVTRVTFYEATEFCQRLSKFLPDGMRAALPTEAQWEFSCRAGTTTAYNWGSEWDSLNSNGWRGVVRDCDATTSVKMFPPNGWGLYDMHGNVREWTSDMYYDYPTGGVTVDPAFPSGGCARVSRGGSWAIPPRRCRSAHRCKEVDGVRYGSLGFRILLTGSDGENR